MALEQGPAATPATGLDALSMPGGRLAALPPVVIVDDDRVAFTYTMRSLRAARLANPIVHLPSGDAAVEHLAAAVDSEAGWPALVLLDVEMPGLSGVEVLRWLRGLTGAPPVPVIMTTSSDDPTRISDAFALGVDAFLLKPVAFHAIVDVISRLSVPWAVLRSSPVPAGAAAGG